MFKSITNKKLSWWSASLCAASFLGAVEAAEPAASTPAEPEKTFGNETSFHELKQSEYKPNATYRIRAFDKGSVGTFGDVWKNINDRRDALHSTIGDITAFFRKTPGEQKKDERSAYKDLRADYEAFVMESSEYEARAYHTNLGLTEIRERLSQLETRAKNLKSVLP